MPDEEDERNEKEKMSKVKIYVFGFLNPVKGQWNLQSTCRFSIRIATVGM